jgi:hypothetical protein
MTSYQTGDSARRVHKKLKPLHLHHYLIRRPTFTIAYASFRPTGSFLSQTLGH